MRRKDALCQVVLRRVLARCPISEKTLPSARSRQPFDYLAPNSSSHHLTGDLGKRGVANYLRAGVLIADNPSS